MTNSEYEMLIQKQEKYPIKLSTYIRNVLFEKELKSMNFKPMKSCFNMEFISKKLPIICEIGNGMFLKIKKEFY